MVMKGVYKITKAILETPEAFALDKRIREMREQGKNVIHLIRQLNGMCRTEVKIVENLIPTVGRAMIANNLTDVTPTNVMVIKHCALGSSTTAPANGDTQLGTEVYRNAIASITNASNVGYATGFFGAAETTGTYKEVGLFCDSTGTANSGVLLSHVAVDITKSAVETLTIDWIITIS